MFGGVSRVPAQFALPSNPATVLIVVLKSNPKPTMLIFPLLKHRAANVGIRC